MRTIPFVAAAILACACGPLGSTINPAPAAASANSVENEDYGRSDFSTFMFRNFPQTAAQMETISKGKMTDPYLTAAHVVVALLRYEESPTDCFAMLEYLNGPNDLSSLERTQIKDRIRGKHYKVLSFFQGATPDNNYTPTSPYKIKVSSNPNSFVTENYATLYVTSGGADSPRPIKLRKKPSTGEWFYTEIQCLADIRKPAAEDAWR